MTSSLLETDFVKCSLSSAKIMQTRTKDIELARNGLCQVQLIFCKDNEIYEPPFSKTREQTLPKPASMVFT